MKRTWSQAQDNGQLGIIESVSLKNFMCHENLHFKFDPHVNFIVGRNGSGKSAILTAIILALGGTSGATGRYSNIKGFIKTGKNSSVISVTLKNCGPDAYKPSEYGKKITIERQINIEGSGHYRIKNYKGHCISTGKEELSTILNAMDIQIDNPITVLTQETSRNFLLSKKPDKLFHLFYRGTGLGKVKDDYSRAAQSKADAEMELLNKKAILPIMEQEVNNLHFLVDKWKEVRHLRNERLWAGVIEFENMKNESQEAFDKKKKEVEECEEKIDSLEVDLASKDEVITVADANKKTVSDKMEGMRKNFTELDRKRVTIASAVIEIKGQYSRHEREVKKFSLEIEGLGKYINEISLQNERDLHADKVKHEMNINSIKNEINKATQHLELLELQKIALSENYSNISKRSDTCQAELREIFYERQRIEQHKMQLIQGKSNRLSVFGREMENVLNDINANARKFMVLPKGPIGLYVNVQQPEWNFAVQECLNRNLLRSFLCDNDHDAEVLIAIFNKHYRGKRPSIITSKFLPRVHNVRIHKTVCKHPTVLDMLNVEDPAIINCLIDQKNIENILLIADPSQAQSLMLYSPPRNCKYACTPNGDQYCHSPYRNYSCRNKNQVSMLKTVNEDDIRKKSNELIKLNQAYETKTSEKNELIHQQTLNNEKINCKDNEIAKFRMTINQLSNKLKDEINKVEEPKDISCFNNDLVTLQNQKQHHSECLASCAQEIQSKNLELDTMKNTISNLRKNLEEESQKFSVLSAKVDEHLHSKEKLNALILKHKTRLMDMQSNLKQCEKELLDVTTKVKKLTVSALKAGPRVETRRSPDAVEKHLKEFEQLIKKQKNCDRLTLVKECEEKTLNLNKAKQELNRLEKTNLRLDHMLASRFQEFKKVCKNTSIALTCCFTSYLRDNNFIGYPDVNFDKNTLDIIVKPKTKSKFGTKQHNSSQLSGGERSYVTIALLLSLWDRIHMPFRILDEYDVFMDSKNRHLSIQQLIDATKYNTRIQYIFLSPLELPMFKNSDCVKIHKMPDPRK